MKLLDRQVAFQDPNPASATRYAALPTISRISDGRTLIVCRVGSTKEAADGRLHLLESRDDGKSWHSLGYPWPIEWKGVPCEQRAGIVTEPATGKLFCAMAFTERKDPKQAMCNVETGGLVPFHLLLSESTDGGTTWSPLREVNAPPFVQLGLTGGVTVLSDSSWALWFETNKHWDDSGKWFHKAAFVRSFDEGKTWVDPTIVAADPAGRYFYWDGRYMVQRDGAILAAFWTYDETQQNDVAIHTVTSRDSGRTWSTPRSTGITGQIATLCELKDGRLLMAYVHRSAPPSLRIRLSGDGGKTWDGNTEFLVYEKPQKSGEVISGAPADYFQDMQAWTFGWISSFQLENGDVLASYYAGDGNISAIYVARLTLGE